MESKKQAEFEMPAPSGDCAIYKALLDEMPVGVYRIDREGRITYTNKPMRDMLGIEHADALGKTVYDFFPDHVATNQRKDDEWIMATGLPIRKTPAIGERQYRGETKSPIRSALGQITGVQAIFWNATELMSAHAELKESEERFSLFMDTLPAAVFIKDAESTTLYCNRYMLDIIGAQRWLGKNVHDIFPKEVATKMIADDKLSLSVGHVIVEEDVPGADGVIRSYQTHKFAIPRQGMPALLGGIAIDVSERKRAELELQTLNARLEILATTDQLSGLANRRSLNDKLHHEMDLFGRYGNVFSVILLDIDHFKSVNDRYGHQAGDRVISQFGGLLTGNVRTVDTPGRWGGEEFLIICPGTNETGAIELAEMMRRRVEQHDFGLPIGVTASFGVASSRPGLGTDELMKSVDDALYEAKEKRNSVCGASP